MIVGRSSGCVVRMVMSRVLCDVVACCFEIGDDSREETDTLTKQITAKKSIVVIMVIFYSICRMNCNNFNSFFQLQYQLARIENC